MQEYGLSERELMLLDVILAPNPHYKSAAPMRLYSERAVQIASHKKLGPCGLYFKKQQRISTGIVRNERRESAQQKRTDELKSALEANGLTLRSDSAVCAAFISGSKQRNLRQCITLMKKAHILHQHTNYSTFLDTAYENARMDDEYDGKFQLHWLEHKSDAEVQALWNYFQSIITSALSELQSPLCACGEIQNSDTPPTQSSASYLYKFTFPVKVKLLRDGLDHGQHTSTQKDDAEDERIHSRAIDIAKWIFNMTSHEELRLKAFVSDDVCKYIEGTTDIEVTKSHIRTQIDEENVRLDRYGRICATREAMKQEFAPYSWGFKRMEHEHFKELHHDLDKGTWDSKLWLSRLSAACKFKLDRTRPASCEKGAYLDEMLMNFIASDDKSLETEPLDSSERKWLHQRCTLMKLGHTTIGTGDQKKQKSIKIEKF